MSDENQAAPLTHDNPKTPQRGYKLCKCNECGFVHECNPFVDFYTEEADNSLESAPLYCRKCLVLRAGLTSKDVIETRKEV